MLWGREFLKELGEGGLEEEDRSWCWEIMVEKVPFINSEEKCLEIR